MKIFKDQEEFFQIFIALVFILIGVLMRLVPHPPNFAPILAIALFGGTYLSKKIALTLPIIAMIISDIFIGFYNPLVMASVYISFILTAVLGLWLKNNKRWYAVSGSALLSAFLFFLITNFAVWAFGHMYSRDFFGLMQSYFMAIPFFKNTFLSNLFYVIVFFGAYEAVLFWVKIKFKIPQVAVLRNDSRQ
ncbi:MAG: hypothetical protein KJI71_01005 [Patescibacteria group bacterium]|nr:hypothetical protein [Patescibacteria group bacterium]